MIASLYYAALMSRYNPLMDRILERGGDPWVECVDVECFLDKKNGGCGYGVDGDGYGAGGSCDGCGYGFGYGYEYGYGRVAARGDGYGLGFCIDADDGNSGST